MGEEPVRRMVFDVPAESGGALTILMQYYEIAVGDNHDEWLFVISTPVLEEKRNLSILRFPWIKKSWFHRFFFDKFIAPRLVKKHKIDEVLSLQNIVVPSVNVKQTLYLHQSLPFVEKRYGIREDFKLWLYQNVISKMIFRSIVSADKVIVQTNWMKAACVEELKVDPEKIVVEKPKVVLDVQKKYNQEDKKDILFFFPAEGMAYKNHKVIVDSVKILKEQKIENFKVIFTLKGNENKDINYIYNIVNENKLPIDFVGKISKEEVYDLYSRSILIFPSFIETFGLPLLEAKLHGSPILASDCAFSHEVLDGYQYVSYFNPFDSIELTNKIKSML